jgi:hypothetical protein
MTTAEMMDRQKTDESGIMTVQSDRLSREDSVAELSIIIVNWNSLSYLRESLKTIYSGTMDFKFETVVVDNASHEDIGQLTSEFPEVRVIRSEQNLGFAGANNLGCRHSSGQYLLFLNPDTKVVGSAIPTMLEKLKSLPDAAVMGCKLLNSDGSVQTSCVQRFPTILNQLLDVNLFRLRWPQSRIWGIGTLFSVTGIPAQVEVVSGACLMIKRDVFAAAGMFNCDYFMYAEDVELCFQVRRLGWKVYCTNDASIVHYGGGTSIPRKGSEWVAVMQREAILRFCRRTRGGLYARLYKATMGVAAVCRLVALALLFPLRRSAGDLQIGRLTSAKWFAVLKWSLGLDGDTFRVHQGT